MINNNNNNKEIIITINNNIYIATKITKITIITNI